MYQTYLISESMSAYNYRLFPSRHKKGNIFTDNGLFKSLKSIKILWGFNCIKYFIPL